MSWVGNKAYKNHGDSEGGDKDCCCPCSTGLHDQRESSFPKTDAMIKCEDGHFDSPVMFALT